MLERAVEDALIAAVRTAARSHILPRYRSLAPADIKAKSRPDDLVTEADLAVERALTQRIAEVLPGALVLGEEAAAADPALIDRAMQGADCVILDPVDGTWNFAHGISVFGTILSVLREGQTIWGLLYDPLMDDWIVVRKGHGVSYVRPGQPPVACTLARADTDPARLGLAAPALFPPDLRPALATRLAARFARTMSLRCSCHEYRLLLQAGAGWLLAPNPMPWDHAAGALAVTELGGWAAFAEDGAPYHPTRRTGTLLVATSAEAWADIRTATGPWPAA